MNKHNQSHPRDRQHGSERNITSHRVQRTPVRAGGATDPADFAINEILDLESHGHLNDAEDLRSVHASKDGAFLERLADTTRVLDQLKLSTAPQPRDLTASIIDRVEQQRLFLPKRKRARIGALRTAVASVGGCALAIIGLLQLRTPDLQLETPPHQPSVATGGGPGVVHHLAEGIGRAADTIADITPSSLLPRPTVVPYTPSSVAKATSRKYDPMRDVGCEMFDELSRKGSSLTLAVNFSSPSIPTTLRAPMSPLLSPLPVFTFADTRTFSDRAITFPAGLLPTLPNLSAGNPSEQFIRGLFVIPAPAASERK